MRNLLSIFLLILSLFFSIPTHATIGYEVSVAHPEQHLFHVSMEIPDVHGDLKLQMAAWNALYEIRDFSSHVQQVEAYADGQRVDIEKLDKLTWDVKATGTITVKYSTFWDDTGPFNSQLNSEHAFINPALILLYVPDRRLEKCTLSSGLRSRRSGELRQLFPGVPLKRQRRSTITWKPQVSTPLPTPPSRPPTSKNSPSTTSPLQSTS